MDAQKLCQGSTYRTKCRSQEDHEAFQHSGFVKENIQRVEAFEASQARECEFPNFRSIKLDGF
jgi:hypothetical protein